MIGDLLDKHDELRALFESAPEVMYTQDLRGSLTGVNRAFERVTGYSRAEVIGRSLLDFVAQGQRDAVYERFLTLLGGPGCGAFDIEFVAKNGRHVQLEATSDLIFRSGIPVGIQGFARDLTEQRRWGGFLQVLHRLTTTNYSDIDALLDEYLRAGCESFSAESGEIRRWIDGDLRSSNTQGCFGDDPYAEQIFRSQTTVVISDPFYLGSPIASEGETVGTISFRSASACTVHPQAREVIELMAKSIGIAIYQRQLTNQLAYQAMHDSLTGLPNRLSLQKRLNAALVEARLQGSAVAVVFIDLDRFKQINDTLGHSIGDGVLQQVGQRLQQCLWAGDTLARMGGDEFTALLTGITGEADALQRAKIMLAAVRAPCRVQHYELFVTASLGVSFYPQDATDADTLLRNADSAMYVAKSLGKNDIHCFTAEGEASALERLALETQLHRALERNELRMLYQPQVRLDGTLAGLEVLLAWEHPELGRIPPSRFIPIAEETGMILNIGAWVLRESCRQLAVWREDGRDAVPIGVNVSALQFTQSNFVTMVADVLRDTGIPAECLELEITESLVMRDVQQSAMLLRGLRELGVRIAIDDFGTGYSSLSYLKRLPANTLKIDRSFLQETEFGNATLPLLQTIVILGHTFGMSVTAEGVETKAQLELIRRAGCDRAQGHLFGAALEREEIERLMPIETVREL